GHVKLFADGSLGSQTALMLEPFLRTSLAEPENTGVRIHESDELVEIFRTAAVQGFPISIHAIGDRANHDVLDVFEELKQGTPIPPAPHRIEHVQILDPQDLPRLGALGITASVQPVHIIDDIAIADRILGERGAHMYNFHSLLSSGALLAFGSDAPVADPNPFLGIHSALYRRQPDQMEKGAWYPAETISLEAAIHAYTMGPAHATGWHHEIGSVELGKRADIIALDRNLFELVGTDTVDAASADAGIADTEVELVLFNGEIVHEDL
ncbi:MAG: amidohydrolase, partial [Caldilineaceae bacterium]